MAPGRDNVTVHAFFEALGEKRHRRLKLLNADAAAWINGVDVDRAPQAERCMDPLHVVQWTTDALDQVRRPLWNDLRRHGDAGQTPPLKNAR